jgi:hypothetical protein
VIQCLIVINRWFKAGGPGLFPYGVLVPRELLDLQARLPGLRFGNGRAARKGGPSSVAGRQFGWGSGIRASRVPHQGMILYPSFFASLSESDSVVRA